MYAYVIEICRYMNRYLLSWENFNGVVKNHLIVSWVDFSLRKLCQDWTDISYTGFFFSHKEAALKVQMSQCLLVTKLSVWYQNEIFLFNVIRLWNRFNIMYTCTVKMETSIKCAQYVCIVYTTVLSPKKGVTMIDY